MDCQRAQEAISAALDGELSPEERTELEAHLSACADCRALAEDLRVLTAALEEAQCPPPPELAAAVMERIAADRTVPISAGRRPLRKRWLSLAAMLALVVCVGGARIWLRGLRADSSAPSANLSGSAEVPSAPTPSSAPMDPAADLPGSRSGETVPTPSGRPAPETGPSADGDADGYTSSGPGAPSDPAPAPPQASDDTPTIGADPGEPSNGIEGEPDSYAFQNERTIRVTWGATPSAPSARILGSVDALDAFAAQFPQDDLSAALDAYDGGYFSTGRLLAVVVEANSGSVSYSIAPQGLRRDQVEIVCTAPKVGTCDMAAWVILAEVDAMFDDADVLKVVFSYR